MNAIAIQTTTTSSDISTSQIKLNFNNKCQNRHFGHDFLKISRKSNPEFDKKLKKYETIFAGNLILTNLSNSEKEIADKEFPIIWKKISRKLVKELYQLSPKYKIEFFDTSSKSEYESKEVQNFYDLNIRYKKCLKQFLAAVISVAEKFNENSTENIEIINFKFSLEFLHYHFEFREDNPNKILHRSSLILFPGTPRYINKEGVDYYKKVSCIEIIPIFNYNASFSINHLITDCTRYAISRAIPLFNHMLYSDVFIQHVVSAHKLKGYNLKIETFDHVLSWFEKDQILNIHLANFLLSFCNRRYTKRMQNTNNKAHEKN